MPARHGTRAAERSQSVPRALEDRSAPIPKPPVPNPVHFGSSAGCAERSAATFRRAIGMAGARCVEDGVLL